MLSNTLLRASKSERARRVVERFGPTRQVVDRFVAGESVDQAIGLVRSLATTGRATTIDFLGEDVTAREGAEQTRDAYLELLDRLGREKLPTASEVSLKLSALGQTLPNGDYLAFELAEEICTAALSAGATVTLDMENHTTIDSTLEIGNELRRRFPDVGNVLQANLFRSEDDLAELAATPTRIRWVKGAYKEPASIAHQRKTAVDDAYIRGLRVLADGACYPMIGTHDPVMLEHAKLAMKSAGRDAASWEVQLLHGVRTDLQEEAVRGAQSGTRIYVPYGTDWYAYFMRRLAERPANVAFFLRALARRS